MGDFSPGVKGHFPLDMKNSPMPYRPMETPLQKRVREKLDELGLSASEASKKAQLGDTFVRDILNGKSRSPSAVNLQKLAIALDTSPQYFSFFEHTPVLAGPFPVSGLRVEGKVQAGAWLDTSLIDDDEEDREIIPVARDTRFPHARQYALAVIGDSMNKLFPEGSYVTCVDFDESGLLMKEGQIVHVERRDGSLTEITIKSVHFEPDRICLMPQSTNPKHQPIEYKRRSANDDFEDGVMVKIRGVVIGKFERVET
jgi:repressor LexA